MKCHRLIYLLLFSHLCAMDRPPQANPEQVSSIIDVTKLDRFLKVLLEKKFEINKDYRFLARRLLTNNDLLTQFALRHGMPLPIVQKMIEEYLNVTTINLLNVLKQNRDLIERLKKEGLTEEQAITQLAIIAHITDYNEAQAWQDTKGEKYFRSKTRQELETISHDVNAGLNDPIINQRMLKVFPQHIPVLKILQSQSAERIRPTITKKQQQNADYLYQVYKEAIADLDTYLQLKPSSELDRIRTFAEESKNQAIQNYLLQKMTQEEINSFGHIFYKISDILKSRSKSKQIPHGLTANLQLLYTFVDRYIKEGDKYKLNLTDQNKNNIKETARTIIADQDALNKLAAWLSVKANVLGIILGKISNMFKNLELPVVVQPSVPEVPKSPWPIYPDDAEPVEKIVSPQLPIAIQKTGFSVDKYIKYAQNNNNAALNSLISESSNDQLQTVLSQVDALIAADEKVVRKYHERFVVTPRKDLAKLRLLMQLIDQELKRRKEEFYRLHPVNKPHPEYPESPR